MARKGTLASFHICLWFKSPPPPLDYSWWKLACNQNFMALHKHKLSQTGLPKGHNQANCKPCLCPKTHFSSVSRFILVRHPEWTLVSTTSGLLYIRIFGRQGLCIAEVYVSCLSFRVRSPRLNRAPSQKQKRSKVLNLNISQILTDISVNVEATPHGGWKLWISRT